MEILETALWHKHTVVAVEETAIQFQKWTESGQNGHSAKFPTWNDTRNKWLQE
jgi:hypothetical protein